MSDEHPSTVANAQTANATGQANNPRTKARRRFPDSPRAGLNKAPLETRTSFEPSASDGVVRFRKQTFNRQDDWYEETITNPDGTEHYHVAGPLSQHRAHGSAKRGQT